MRRKLLLFALALLICAPMIYSQNFWGAKLGINAGTLTGEDADAVDWGAETKDAKAGFVGGAFFDFRFGEFVGLRPELLYSAKGVKYESGDVDVEIRLRTLELPFLLQFFLPIPTEAVDVALFAGPAPALILSGKYAYSEPGYDEEGDAEDAGFELTTLDLCIAFGGALSVPAGPGEVLLDFRYTIALLSAVDRLRVDLDGDGVADVSVNDPILRTGTFGATIGYGFLF